MKSLSDYTRAAHTALFEKTGAFFAFSQSQFEEHKKEGVTYVALDGGLVSPKENVDELIQGFSSISKSGIAQDLAENGREAIIRRELANYECFYTRSIEDCVDALKDYGITEEEVRAVYIYMCKHEDA